MNEAYVIPFYAIIEDIQRVTRENGVHLATLQEARQWSWRPRSQRAGPRFGGGPPRRDTLDTTMRLRLDPGRSRFFMDRTGIATDEKSESTASTLVSTPIPPMINSRPIYRASSIGVKELTNVEAGRTSSTAPQTENPVHTTAAANVATSAAASTEPSASVLKSTIIPAASDRAKSPSRLSYMEHLMSKENSIFNTTSEAEKTDDESKKSPKTRSLLLKPSRTAFNEKSSVTSSNSGTEARESLNQSLAPNSKGVPAASSDTEVIPGPAKAGLGLTKYVTNHLRGRGPNNLPGQNLECPFDLAFLCSKSFSNEDDWINHSLEHFCSGGRVIQPPTANICCFCKQTFYSAEPYKSWKERMIHVGRHHDLGHTLLQARPDFALFDYLFKHRLIDEKVYGILNGRKISQRLIASPEAGPHKPQHEKKNEGSRTPNKPVEAPTSLFG